MAARSVDLLEPFLLRERYCAGDLREAERFRVEFGRAVATRLEATPVAAAILSFATCVMGVAFDIRGQVPPYQDLPDCGWANQRVFRFIWEGSYYRYGGTQTGLGVPQAVH